MYDQIGLCDSFDGSCTDVVARRLAVLQLADRLGSVTHACQRLGFSRATFYRIKQRHAVGGIAGLRDVERRGHVPKNRFAASTEQLVVELARAHPTWGRRRLVRLLAQHGVAISPSGVRCIWKRRGLLSARARSSDLVMS